MNRSSHHSFHELGRGSALLVATCALGCQFAFGTYSGTGGSAATTSTGGATAAGGAAATGGTAATGGSIADPCSPQNKNVYGCAGDQLSRCDGTQWVSTTCAVGTTCDQARGQCDTCSQGDVKCGTDTTDGSPVVLTCDLSINDYQQVKCTGSTPVCDADLGKCVVCNPNSEKCELDAGVLTGKIIPCKSDGTGWDNATACTSGYPEYHPVDGANDYCVECHNAEQTCAVVTGSSVRIIKDCLDEKWRTTQTCDGGCTQNPLGCAD